MKRNIAFFFFTFSFLTLFNTLGLKAQVLEHLEGELAQVTTEDGGGYDIELRYCMKEKPVDFGVRWRMATICDTKDTDDFPEGTVYAHLFSYVKAYADYNFRQGKKCSFFVGAGVGAGDYHTLSVWRHVEYQLCPVLTCRAGINICNHVRVGLGYNYIPSKDSFMEFSLSYSIRVQTLLDTLTK
ncbi:MAG: hypothetical protein J5814_08020 [Bacteroidaceae bacterium]|nr:hypothetical protein [Bacteroidaceae bacterium]